MTGTEEEAEVAEQEPPAQVDPSGRWTRSNDILGKGAFKTVYKGFDDQEGLEVAWNQIRMNELVSTKEDRERLFAEIRVLKQLKHKNIMTFFDSWLENKGYTVNFITELFTSGTLRQYRKRHKQMDPEVMKRWAWQILCGLVYLHGHTPPIIHRDLKCDNIFINGSEGVVKIGDLGLATMLRARTAPQSVLGTPEFMAPELYDEEYDDRVDVYSFGMCLLELATLEYPYSECRNAAQIYRKVTLGVRPKALARVGTKELAEFICYCIQPRLERPRSRQLLKHPYFDSIRAERCSLKLSAEALGLPVPPNESPPDIGEYATSAGSSSVSRTSSAAGELHNVSNMILDAVPEEEDEGSSTHDGLEESKKAVATQLQPQGGKVDKDRHSTGGEPASKITGAVEKDDADSLREFKVKGRLQEAEDKLNLRLRILQPERAAKVVEFDFDLASDTAMSVASEMVEEMSLSHSDAHRIAHAIKEEIYCLTHKVSHAPDLAYIGSGSDDEATAKRQALSDSGQAELTADRGTAPQSAFVEWHGSGGCDDSAMSLHESHRDPASPEHLLEQPLRPAASSHNMSVANSSPPDSHMSFGSSPAAEPMMVDPPVLRGPILSNPSSKPPTSFPPARSFSERILQRLGRTDSANHAQEVEALQQALGMQGDGNTGRFLFAPPNEEDRRLPLKKLLENLQEVECHSNGQAPSASTTHPLRMDLPLHSSEVIPKGTSEGQLTPRTVANQLSQGQPVPRQPDLQRMSFDAAYASSPASTSGRQLDVSNGPNPFLSMQASRTSSPRQEFGQPVPSSSAPDLQINNILGLRTKSKADLAEAKELRRQAAQTSLKNMESKSLEGLDTFGVSRGCKQAPIKSLMGWGK